MASILTIMFVVWGIMVTWQYNYNSDDDDDDNTYHLLNGASHWAENIYTYMHF